MNEPLGWSPVCSPVKICDACLIDNGGMVIVNLFNNKINNMTLSLGDWIGTSNGGAFVHMAISNFDFCVDDNGTK